MLKNYLKISWRNLRKYKSYSVINLLGLATGLACCIFILLYIEDEFHFDKFHDKWQRIYRVVETRNSPDQGERKFAVTFAPLGPTMRKELPEVVDYVRFIMLGRFSMNYKDKLFYEGDYLISEPSFFDIFDFKLLQGDRKTALSAPNSVVLTEETAEKYFGDENPMGKTLSAIDRGIDFKVTGVLRKLSHNSHLQFNMLFSLATFTGSEGVQRYLNSWDSDGMITYLLLDENNNISEVEKKLPGLVQKYRSDNSEEIRQVGLQPLADIHFHSTQIESDRNANKGEMGYVYVFGIIAIFIIVIACINYMNLATARSINRANEVGLRKVVGAHKMQLIGQFLSESVLLSLVSLILALAVVQHLLPAFNSLTGKELVFILSGQGLLLAALILITLLVGLVSGSYPAFYLSGLQIIRILKGKLKASTGDKVFRRGLVITQFALSIIMIIATIVVFKQMQYIQNKRLGFNQDHLVVVDINSGGTRRDFRAIKNEFAQSPEVRSVSVTSRVPGEWKNLVEIEVQPERKSATDLHTMTFFGVDQDFLNTFEVELVNGRNFLETMSTDTTAVLINESAAQVLGWKSPVGKTFRVPEENFQAHVIGVVKDFNFRSLHEKIGPLVLGHSHNPIQSIDYFTVRISGKDIPGTLAYLQRVHERYDKITPFEYHFLDQQLQNFYENDRRVGNLFGIAAGLAIFIACLGLFGLAAFTAEQRTKEIGVRKVLGASVSQIILLLSKEFTKLVLIALLVAAPLAYFAAGKWLQEFAYRIEIGPAVFLLAGFLALLISWATVSYQAVKAAVANPVESLRYE